MERPGGNAASLSTSVSPYRYVELAISFLERGGFLMPNGAPNQIPSRDTGFTVRSCGGGAHPLQPQP
jgi:hypothetical protein